MTGATIALAVLAYIAITDPRDEADRPTSLGLIFLFGVFGYGAQALVEGVIRYIGSWL